MWGIVVGGLGAAVIAVGGWLFNRVIDKRDKLSDKLDKHEAECHKHWTENAKTLDVHGEKLSNLEKGQDKMHDKLDRILETRPVKS